MGEGEQYYPCASSKRLEKQNVFEYPDKLLTTYFDT
jgi:hypothetical protein